MQNDVVEKAGSDVAPERRRCVLLVDDSRTFQTLFRTALEQSDFELRVCNDGREALELIAGRYVDFICSAFFLPDMEGIELCRKVRQLPQCASKPFVLLTSVDNANVLAKALPAGVTDIFHRNDVAQLLAFIKRFPSANTRLSGRVLYVEDNSSQRLALTAMLEDKGLVVDAFASADEAWKHFQHHDHDLVLTDIVLDGTMSGLAFVNKIRRETSAKGDTPILAVTAFDDKTRRIELFNLGVTDYILKPVAEEELFVRIGGLLDKRRFAAEIELVRRQHQEVELALSDNRFQTLFASMTEGAALQELVCGTDGKPVNYRLLNVNPAFATHTGLAAAAVLGKLATEVFGTPEAPFVDVYAKVAETGEPVEFEPYFASLGRYFRIRVCAMKDRRFATIFEDITGRKEAELDLRVAAAAFESQEGMLLTDANSVILRVNRAFTEMTGYTTEEAVGKTPRILQSGRHDAAFYRAMWESINRTGGWQGEIWDRRKNGEVYLKWLTISSVRDADGNVSHYFGTHHDISARKQAETDLRIAATAFESQEGMVVTDADGVILRVNQAFVESTGYTAEELVGQTTRLLKSGRHSPEFYRDMWQSIERTGGWQGEIWDRRKNGEEYPKWLTISAVKDGAGVVTNYVGAHFDITERKRAEEKIRTLAFFDQLTGLPNRALLLDRLKQTMATISRGDGHGALLFIDLDNFKKLNDTLGHDVGDMLLKQVAQRLASCVREGDSVARLGGDEFVVMLTSLGSMAIEAAASVETVAEKILGVLGQVYPLNGTDFHCTASIGITLFGSQPATIDDLMKQADLAMYKAKDAGRNAFRFFDPEMESVVAARATLESDLRRALAERQFVLHYQAQVGSDGRVTGAEVLLRWQHSRRGMVSPAEFIPLSEETGLIVPLGRWVLETACAQLALWAARPETRHLTIAVNVSACQFGQADFVRQVLAILQASGANPLRLKLELTESLMARDLQEIVEKMTALKARGVGFSLDDFGTGYSSLSYLKRLPLDQLKIDQSFVRDVLVDGNDAAIARTVVALGQSLGLGVIAEGVETAAQRDFLAANGCHAYQGYLFGRPMPIDAFEQFALQP